MEEIVGFLGFSLGVTLAGGVVRSLSGGLRPLARGAIKAGLMATDMVTSTVAKAGSAVAGTAAEARENLGDLRAEAKAGEAQPSDTAPRQIIIARE